MRRWLPLMVLLLAALWSCRQQPSLVLAFDTPAADWESECIPLGNGFLGASVFGGVDCERIVLNEKSLWTGGPGTGVEAYWNASRPAAEALPAIREALASEDYGTADRLTREHFRSNVSYEPWAEHPFRFGFYSTLGDLAVCTGLDTLCTGYRRELSLDEALARVSFRQGDRAYERTAFVSYPDRVLVLRLRGQQQLSIRYTPCRIAQGRFEAEEQGFHYEGSLPENGLRFSLRLTVLGTAAVWDGEALCLEPSGDVTLLVTAATDYRMNFAPDFSDPAAYVGEDPALLTAAWMQAARAKGYQALLKTHLRDYQPLFQSVSLELDGPEVNDAIPSRLARYRSGEEDPALEALYFQYGRYLLLASSREGSLPANLQGLWHNGVDGPWHVDYHNNINLQMNYWPAQTTRLEACFQPYTDFLRLLEKPGERTARAYFGARGWTASISANPFGFTDPLDSWEMEWNYCPVAGPWLATALWNHYDFTRDKAYLEAVYPLLRGAADFATDLLWRGPDGYLTAAPSFSPEHGPVDAGTAFSHAVIREILQDAIGAARVLGQESGEWEAALKELAPYRIGRYGQLQEWSRDIDHPEDQHRHVNHLFGLYPGHTLDTPELKQAARVVLEHRGDGATGWSMGWKLCLWARLQDGDHAHRLLRNLLSHGTLDNLWDNHPPFQIDGNFGGTAGMAEMLLQSQDGVVELLPALPQAWPSGRVKGLCARGGFVLDLDWKDGQLKTVRLYSRAGGTCTLRHAGREMTVDTREGESKKITW